MRIKRKNGLKIAAITIALLLCLALAVGITGAWYQAKRQATGTLSMDQGIIIDYKGFGKTPDEGIWSRETTTTFLLFDETNAQPGEQIAVNAAGIRANENSVNFYARVKLTYKFYNGETPVELADATKLIKTSSSFWANSWVDGGSSDGYYYYATGSTLNKFEKGAAATTSFVDLFATDAKFVIEGAGFTGADNNGEGGGFKIDDTTLINKIEVYLTLETLQGDATAEQAKALGWKIASPVKFAEATGKMETSVNKTATTEDLNVSVAGVTEVPINEVVFPYDTDTTLKFDSNNVEYVTLTYSNNETETFEETAINTITVKADSSKGKVTGYTVGLWNDSEYTGFTYSTKGFNQDMSQYNIEGGIAVVGYFGDATEITLPASTKVRNRDFKIELNYQSYDEFENNFYANLGSLQYPVKIANNKFENIADVYAWMGSLNKSTFMSDYPSPMIITYETYCDATGLIGTNKNIIEIGVGAFYGKNITSLSLSSDIKKINFYALQDCINLTSININNVTFIGNGAFSGCSNLTTSIGDIGGNWVKASDNTAVDASTLLKDIDYDIKKV